MIMRLYELPTIGERFNSNNSLEPDILTGVKAEFITIEYFDEDKKVKIVAFGNSESDFIAYANGVRLPDKLIPEGIIKRKSNKNGLVIDSINKEDIGKYEAPNGNELKDKKNLLV